MKKKCKAFKGFARGMCIAAAAAAAAAVVATAAAVSHSGAWAQSSNAPITVFVAQKIITMDPTRPHATAVAVRDGTILAVGSLQNLQP